MSVGPAPLPRFRFRRPRISAAWRQPLAIVGITLALLWIVIAVLAPLLSPHDPLAQNAAPLLSPSGDYPFGTDELGRDVLSRVIWGARLSIPLALLLVGLAVLIGATLGAIAGYFGGIVDSVVMRSVDLVFAFPAIILAMVVTAALGPSIRNAVLALVVVSWPAYARVVRGLVLSVGQTEYVTATRLLGASARRALVRDVLPNVAGPVLVLATLDLGNAVLLLAGLSFLGLGAQPPTPEWGAGVAEGTQYFQFWWIGTFPGLAIFSVVLAFNFLGDSLRDVLDPQSSWRAGGEGRMSLLEVEGLTVKIRGEAGTVTIVDGVDYEVEERQIFGVAGESGSGKTMSVLALLQLLPRGAQTSGRATYEGRDLLTLSARGLRQVRGRELAMVFQDPLTSLHPMMTDRPPALRARPVPRRALEECGPRPRRGAPRRGTAARSGAGARCVPAPVLWWDAPARGDRERTRHTAEAADRR